MPFNSVLSVHPRHRIDCKLSWQVPCPLLLVNWALVPWGCLTLTTPSLDSTRPVTSTCHPEGWIPYLQPGRRRGQRRKEQKGHLRRNRGMRAVLEEVSWCLVGWAVRTCTCSVAIQWAHVMEMCDAYCVCMCGKCSKQRTHWGHHKFSCCVLCREVVLFSKLINVLGKPIVWNLEKCPL